MAKQKMKAVVTGGAGFIGSHIVDALLKKGFAVHIIDNLSGGRKENINKKAVFHNVDIRNLEALKPIMKGAEFVFHFAALPRVQYSIEYPEETSHVNIMGTMNVFIASTEGGVKRVVYSASSSAYGDQSIMPLTEEMKPGPKSPYGLQKYVGELYAKVWSEVYGLSTVSLRYFNVYGPRLNPDGAYALVIGKFLKQRKDGMPITVTGDGEQTRDFTHVSDVVDANLRAATSKKVGKGEVLNIGAGRNFSINKVAELIGGLVEYVPVRMEPHDTLADNSLAREKLGWKPKMTLDKGIGELKKIWKLK
jgi:UDP-glucose 4-epimerase